MAVSNETNVLKNGKEITINNNESDYPYIWGINSFIDSSECEIAELIIYEKNLSLSDMKKVSSYLMKKYNIIINRCPHEHFTLQSLELYQNVAPVSKENNKCIKCGDVINNNNK